MGLMDLSKFVRKEVLYSIFIGFGFSMKLVRPIKMCLNVTYCKVYVGKLLSEMFPIHNGLKQVDGLPLMLFKFAL
jgi:hypothetical protein